MNQVQSQGGKSITETLPDNIKIDRQVDVKFI